MRPAASICGIDFARFLRWVRPPAPCRGLGQQKVLSLIPASYSMLNRAFGFALNSRGVIKPMYQTDVPDPDDTLMSLNEAIEDFHRIRTELQQSGGLRPPENAEHEVAELSLVPTLD